PFRGAPQNAHVVLECGVPVPVIQEIEYSRLDLCDDLARNLIERPAGANKRDHFRSHAVRQADKRKPFLGENLVPFRIGNHEKVLEGDSGVELAEQCFEVVLATFAVQRAEIKVKALSPAY